MSTIFNPLFLCKPQTPHIMSVKTDNAGTSASNQFTFPTVSTRQYSCTVHWGDGTQNQINSASDAAWTHTYPSAGTYTIKIYGPCGAIQFNNGGDRLKLLSITQWGTDFSFGNATGAYYGCSNLVLTSLTDTPNLTGITNLSSLFRNCTSITTIANLGSWDVSKVTTFTTVFNGCTNFNQSLASWNVSSGTAFNSMFAGATNFNSSVDGWVFGPSVTTFAAMFQNCSSYNQPMNNWVLHNITTNYSMANMLQTCTVFNSNIVSWNVSKCTSMAAMISGCGAFNQNISGWNVSSVIAMNSMFQSSPSFNQPIGSWNVSSVTTFINFLRDAVAFNQNLGGWTLSPSLTTMANMLNSATLSNANYNLTLNGWAVAGSPSGISFSAGLSRYDTTSGGVNGVTARSYLTATKGWTIIDGGTP